MRSTFVLVMLALTIVTGAARLAAAAPATAAPPDRSQTQRTPIPILGCWQNMERPTVMIRFEPTRRLLADKDLFDVSPVKSYGTDHLVVVGMGAPRRVGFSLQGETLTLTDEQGRKHVFRRLAAVPPEFELKPAPLGRPEKLTEAKIAEVRKELARRVALDQGVRKKVMDPAERAKIKTEADMRAIQEEAAKIDGDNTRYLKSLIREVGWIDALRFGPEAANGAFLLVQHSGDIRMMMAAEPEIEKDMKAKRVDPQDYALLYDRLHLQLEAKQRFGTQVGQNAAGALVVLPLESRLKVDEFRKEIGLFPWSKYLDTLKQMTGAKEVVFEGEWRSRRHPPLPSAPRAWAAIRRT